MDRQLPWEKMNQFILQCGLQRDSRGLAETALRKLSALIPFDQGRLYFLNSQGQVCDYRLLGVDKSTVRNYLAYHSQLEDGAFSLPCRIRHHQTPFPTVCDWSQMDHSREFYQECVRPITPLQSWRLSTI